MKCKGGRSRLLNEGRGGHRCGVVGSPSLALCRPPRHAVRPPKSPDLTWPDQSGQTRQWARAWRWKQVSEQNVMDNLSVLTKPLRLTNYSCRGEGEGQSITQIWNYVHNIALSLPHCKRLPITAERDWMRVISSQIIKQEKSSIKSDHTNR